MYNNKQISYSDPYYNLIQLESVETVDLFHKFSNWAQSEFDLYLQDTHHSGLKVYYPNGWFSIQFINKNGNGLYIELKIESKSLKNVKKIEAQLNSLFCCFNKHKKNHGVLR